VSPIAIEPLAADAFEPFGRVIERPAREADALGPGWRWWAETAMLDGDGRAWGVGYLDLEPGAAGFDWAERHARTLEVVVPLTGPCLVYVAPADPAVERPADGAFRVFRVPEGAGVILDRGVWHGAPLADGRPARAIVLILEGTGRDDVETVRFDRPIGVEAGRGRPTGEG
jgi:ureidoglycolate hydrolase